MAPPISAKVGDRFGSRVVIKMLAERARGGQVRVRWRCDCGQAGTSSLGNIRHKLTCVNCRPGSYRTKVGDRFGSRVITGFLKTRDTDGHLRCRWKCDCGNKGTGGLKSLRHTLLCQRCKPFPASVRNTSRHGHTKRGARTKLYDAWANMMQRTNPNTSSLRNRRWYKGIKVCPEWQTFEGFRDWALANGYREGLSLDRIRTVRGYEPSNCEWVTRSENSRRAAEDEWRNHHHTPIEILWGET